MNIPKRARYDYCMQKACEFLEEYSISSYPIDVEKIIHDNHWGLTTYSLLMEKFNCDRDTVIECLRSKDGYTQLDCDNYSIAYNDDPALGDRIRFTLMHEIGHIYLNHLIDFDMTLLYRGSISNEENKVLENEANAFARNVLAPTTLINQLIDKDKINIAKIFGITKDAAITRIGLLETDCKRISSLKLARRMINIFKKFYNNTRCNNCDAQFTNRYRNYCPICGSKNTLTRGNGLMNYKEYKTNSEGYVEKCIRCENPKIIGDFCHICGAPSRNYCSDCAQINNEFDACTYSKPLPGNARYCPQCGSKSRFYSMGILEDWSTEFNQISEDINETENLEVDDIDSTKINPFAIFEVEEELPFN